MVVFEQAARETNTPDHLIVQVDGEDEAVYLRQAEALKAGALALGSFADHDVNSDHRAPRSFAAAPEAFDATLIEHSLIPRRTKAEEQARLRSNLLRKAENAVGHLTLGHPSDLGPEVVTLKSHDYAAGHFEWVRMALKEFRLSLAVGGPTDIEMVRSEYRKQTGKVTSEPATDTLANMSLVLGNYANYYARHAEVARFHRENILMSDNASAEDAVAIVDDSRLASGQTALLVAQTYFYAVKTAPDQRTTVA